MTDNERILVRKISGKDVPGEENAICGSIQNYRRIERRAGRILSFEDAALEWKERIYDPIIRTLREDPAASLAVGRNINPAFFSALYNTECSGFRFDRDLVRNVAMEKAHGIRAFISRLIA